jgi:cytidine deaminase
VALYSAVTAGARVFRRIVIAASGRMPYPCGACRQALSEFSPSLGVTVVGADGEHHEFSLDELLPHPFTLSEGLLA